MSTSPNRRRFLLAALAAPFARARAEPPAHPPARMTIAYPMRSSPAWVPYAASEGGYYAKEGLDVTLKFGVHPAGIAMLTSGEAQMAIYSIDIALLAAIQDASFVLRGTVSTGSTFELIAAAGRYPRIKDLKGARIAVGRVGDAPYYYTVLQLRAHGLTARDVQWIPTGADASGRLTALTVGQVDAAALTAPAYFRLLDSGKYSALPAEPSSDDESGCIVCLYRRSTPLWISEAVTRAHAATVKRLYEDRDFAVKAFAANNPRMQIADVERLYALSVDAQRFPRVPLVLKSNVAWVLSTHGESRPELKSFDFAKVIDNGQIMRLASDGWLSRLFGTAANAELESKLKRAYGA